MQRNLLVDRLKGYACFLVLFGHVIMGVRLSGIDTPSCFINLESFIWSFHVPLFFFLSGVVYKITNEWKSKKSKAQFLKHKLINLGVPYVFFSIIYILINSLVATANTSSSVKDILFIWKTPIAQYWFLYSLFFLFVIWTVLEGTLKNWQITLAVFLFGYLAPAFNIGFGSFEAVVFSALPFGLGTVLNPTLIEKRKDILKIILIIIHVAFAIGMIYLNIIEKPIFKEMALILGIAASIGFIELITRLKPFAKFLDFFSKYSFQIYLLHTFFTAGCRIVLLKIGVTQWYIHIIIGSALGIFGSVLAALLAKRIKPINFLFFPSATINKKI